MANPISALVFDWLDKLIGFKTMNEVRYRIDVYNSAGFICEGYNFNTFLGAAAKAMKLKEQCKSFQVTTYSNATVEQWN